MASQSVYITRSIPESGIAALTRAELAVKMNPFARGMRREELCEEVGKHDAVICQLADPIDESVLRAAAPRCRVFATCAVGFDNIDLKTAAELGITITNTPDVLTDATADLAWALLMAAARRLGEGERFVRAGAWQGWGMLDYLGADVWGTTLGIVGAGRIGTAIARRAQGFSMQVLYYNRSPNAEMDAMGARRVELAELLKNSDYVSLHVPLNDETRQLIDEKAIRSMKRSAILINTARGAVVDQVALIEALQEGRIAAAGLDVYQNEPHVPKELIDLENVVLLPHIGSATISTRSRMARIAADNVIAVLNGEPPKTPIALR